jgi:hypothetical protein
MTNDEIIQIARLAYKSCEHIPNVKIPPEFIERFVNLIAQQEREACAYRARIALLGVDRDLAIRVDKIIGDRHEPR